MADFTQTTNLPVCWCAVEATDHDPTAFLYLLAYSIADRFHEIEAESLFKLVKRGDTNNSIHRITELLHDMGPLVLIIDDYHKGVSVSLTLALNKLLDQLPASISVIIAARGDMGLETNRIIEMLLTQGTVGLSEADLRFTPQEIQFMMRKRFGRRVELQQAQDIAQATQGNIAHILLTGHMMHSGRSLNLKQRLGDNQDVVYAFLADDVFAKQTPELQQFLLYTAILPDIDPEFCDEFLGITQSRDLIESLIRKDLFISLLGITFKYHDLFADFLRNKLAQDEQRYHAVTMQAAQLLVAHARVEDAINLYLFIHAWAEAVSLLETQGYILYTAGRVLTLDNWLDQIPATELHHYPRLLLLRGQILHRFKGDPQLALTYHHQAEAQFLTQADLIGAAEAKIARSVSLRMMGQVQESLTLVSEGVDQLEQLQAKPELMAEALQTRSIAYGVAGNVVEALIDIRRGLTLFESLHDTYNIGRCHHNIGINLKRQGKINAAKYHYQQSLQIWESLNNTNGMINILNNLGVLFYNLGDYDQALTYLQNCLEIALQVKEIRRAAFAQAGIGDIYLDCQQYAQALEAYHLSTQFAQKTQAKALVVYNQVKIGETYYRQADLAQAGPLAQQALELAAETGLVFEKGLALTLLSKIYILRAEYQASFPLCAQAVASFSHNDVLEQAKVRLWWAYALLLDVQPTAAHTQLQEVIRLALAMGELITGLGETVQATRPLLYHFLHQPHTSAELADNIRLLLQQCIELPPITSPDLQVFAFGSPAIIIAGDYKQFYQRGRMRKTPEFLAYLLIENQGRGCRWHEVSAVLWPETTPQKASGNFHQTLRRLREVIFQDAGAVVIQEDHYQINAAYLTWCDALAFESLLERINADTSAQTLNLQLELINIYQGEFLAGFELSSWGIAYRTACEIHFLQVVVLAADHLLQQNQAQQVLLIVKRGLEQDYFREELHRLMLRAYAHLKLYNALTDHYRDLVKIFAQDMNVPPDDLTQQLYQQLITAKKV